jgi:hypothetical protein
MIPSTQTSGPFCNVWQLLGPLARQDTKELSNQSLAQS